MLYYIFKNKHTTLGVIEGEEKKSQGIINVGGGAN